MPLETSGALRASAASGCGSRRPRLGARAPSSRASYHRARTHHRPRRVIVCVRARARPPRAVTTTLSTSMRVTRRAGDLARFVGRPYPRARRSTVAGTAVLVNPAPDPRAARSRRPADSHVAHRDPPPERRDAIPNRDKETTPETRSRQNRRAVFPTRPRASHPKRLTDTFDASCLTTIRLISQGSIDEIAREHQQERSKQYRFMCVCNDRGIDACMCVCVWCVCARVCVSRGR